MYRPAGYSSEEEDYDEFGFNYYSLNQPQDSKTKSKQIRDIKPIELTDEQKYDIKLTQVFSSTICGNVNEVLDYIKNGFDVNTRLKENWSLLLLSASIGNPSLTLELIKKGADVNQHRDMMTPLMMACNCPTTTSPYEKSFEVIKALIENGADPTLKDRKRMTALMFASSIGHLMAVQLLLPLSNKHDVDNQGWNALFWAINDNQFKTVQLLMEAEIDYKKSDVRQNKPIDYAMQNGFEDIINLFPQATNQKKYFSLEQSHYNINDFNSFERPKFTRDIAVMLYGMKCENLADKLIEKNIDLLTFLTMNQNALEINGIKLPYQQNRILLGLYKFHKCSYSNKSIQIVGKNENFNTFDVSKSIITAIRHIITMQAALKYIELNFDEPFNTTFINNLKGLQRKVNSLKNIVILLDKKAVLWDLENKPADLITNKNNSNKWIKWTPIFGVITVILYYTFKK